MADLLLKDFTRAELDRMTQMAQAADLDRMNWTKQILLQAVNAPLVRRRYAYRGHAAANGATVVIRRLGDGSDQVEGNLDNAEGAQIEAERRARELIRRNEPGDREHALRLLHEARFELFEIPV